MMTSWTSWFTNQQSVDLFDDPLLLWLFSPFPGLSAYLQTATLTNQFLLGLIEEKYLNVRAALSGLYVFIIQKVHIIWIYLTNISSHTHVTCVCMFVCMYIYYIYIYICGIVPLNFCFCLDLLIGARTHIPIFNNPRPYRRSHKTEAQPFRAPLGN